MLAALLKTNGIDLAFNLLDIGAVPIEGKPEPYYQLLGEFASSRLSAFELDTRVCEELNRNAPRGVRFHACALGKTEETRPLYHARDPMCSSLYAPDERFADLFNELDVTRLAGCSEVATVSLDHFARENALGAVDFVKIDAQGAALEIFKGGARALQDVLFIVCEVEFVPMYKDQPLFGEVDAWLRQHGLMFHKFLGIGGRVMKPLAVQGRADYPVQFMWSDAVFTRDLFSLEDLSTERQLKLAVLCDLYDSKDVALHLLRRYDAAHDDDLADIYLDQLRAAGAWGLYEPPAAGKE